MSSLLDTTTHPKLGGGSSRCVMTVARPEVEAFAAALGEPPLRTSTGDDGQLRSVVPLGFGSRLSAEAVLNCVTEALDGRGFQGVVQVAHHCRFDRLVELGKQVETAAQVVDRHAGPSGTILEIGADLASAGRSVASARLTLLVLGIGADPTPRTARRRRPSADGVLRDPVLCETFRLEGRHAGDYADAAGDPNPVHTDPAAARAAGHPGVIVPGLCLVWLATAGVVRRFGGNDPARVVEMSARFTAPAAPGETVRLWAGPIGDRVIGFRLTGERRTVVKTGRIRLRPVAAEA